MSRYYVGFDCGTMGTKTAIYRDDSTRMAEAYRENKISYPQPGWAEMDALGFVRNVREGVRECLMKSGVYPRDISQRNNLRHRWDRRGLGPRHPVRPIPR
ncbi:MAG: FGGY family carbohydrate kinase [Synergistaceae bacterium]|nr:FGGY family carbohydrate kinase [Synergistaceae bacterium]